MIRYLEQDNKFKDSIGKNADKSYKECRINDNEKPCKENPLTWTTGWSLIDAGELGLGPYEDIVEGFLQNQGFAAVRESVRFLVDAARRATDMKEDAEWAEIYEEWDEVIAQADTNINDDQSDNRIFDGDHDLAQDVIRVTEDDLRKEDEQGILDEKEIADNVHDDFDDLVGPLH